MSIYSQVGNLLNSADPILRNIPDEGHRKKMLKGLGGLMWGREIMKKCALTELVPFTKVSGSSCYP